MFGLISKNLVENIFAWSSSLLFSWPFYLTFQINPPIFLVTSAPMPYLLPILPTRKVT